MANGPCAYLIILFVLLVLLDWYIFYGFRSGFSKLTFVKTHWFPKAYWIWAAGLLTGLILVIVLKTSVKLRAGYLLVFFINLIFKICFALFLLMDDLRRTFLYIIANSRKRREARELRHPDQHGIPRSEFLLKAGLLAGAVPLSAIGLTMKSGLYDYQVVRKTIYLSGLPKAFDGLKIGQISDLHCGSFFNKTAVAGGVDMLMREKADVIFFTGDLLNNYSNELKDYQDLFTKVKAPLGVYSCLGNHDYGDYVDWKSPIEKEKNHREIINAHKNMGWNLLQDAHRRLKVNGQEIGILGIGNWGAISHYPQYGRMEAAIRDTDDLPVKLLLSHDPTHWRAQVLPLYQNVDMAFAGHTHGMQMGIRTSDFQWSPVEYIYNEWAGLYHENHQQLYVNVGYGFFKGFNGRVGILPEITIFELKAGAPRPTLKT